MRSIASFVREYVRRVLLLKMTMESRRGGGKGELEEVKRRRMMAAARIILVTLDGRISRLEDG